MPSLGSLRRTKIANQVRGYWYKLRPPSPSGLLEEISSFHLAKPQKILHIGANNGREARYYHQHDIKAWHVEAIPDAYELLCGTCKLYPDQYPVKACLSNKNGCDATFNIASNSGESSSLLGLGRHQKAYPSIQYVKSITVRTTTVDDLIASAVIPADIDFLVIDAQGSELLILQGAERLLQSGSINGAMIETAVEPLYEGGARYLDVCSMLKNYGLYLCKASFNTAGWCDALFSKKYWP